MRGSGLLRSPACIPGSFPLEEAGAKCRSRTDVADSPWEDFLAKVERNGIPGILDSSLVLSIHPAV